MVDFKRHLKKNRREGLFPDHQKYLILDYETYSEANLKKMGAYEYARHPSTSIICGAWRLGTRAELRDQLRIDESGYFDDASSWSYQSRGTMLYQLAEALVDPSIVAVAHNAFFEQMITRFVLASMLPDYDLDNLPPSRWICTATLACTLAVPRGLEGAAEALGLAVKKDMEGNRLLKKMMKPRKPTKKNPFPGRHENPEDVARLTEYCKTDIDAETLLFLKAPPLMPMERDVWLLDQEINARGFAVDRPLIKRVLRLIKEETEALDEETETMTCGGLKSAKQRDGVLEWLRNYKCHVPNLKRKTVEDMIESGLVFGDALRLLEIRLAVSKSSTAKYEMLDVSSKSDGRVRDTLLYHAAATGRWGGARVQPQNFPRPHLKFPAIKAVIDIVNTEKDNSRTTALDMVRVMDDNPMRVFASMLRSTIVAPKGKILDVADYNAIEVRVLFWLANHEKGLEALRNNAPIYEELAAKIFRVPVESIEEDSFERYVGKTAELGCGYGMGPPKFQMTCRDQGREISMVVAKAAVQTYRTENKPVCQLWYNLERAAVAAVMNKDKCYTVNHTKWFMWREFLVCQLPSGRQLYYLSPRIGYVRTPWDDRKQTLFYLGVGKNRKMVLEKTYGGKLAENVSQGVARDVMANAMIQIQKAGYWDIVLSVHDELISERKIKIFGGGSNEKYIKIMQTVPEWAPGLPLLVKGWEGTRYRK